MLDAAALASNSEIDLKAYPADFLSLSFYKIFGYPSGVGVLIVKNGKKSATTSYTKSVFLTHSMSRCGSFIK